MYPFDQANPLEVLYPHQNYDLLSEGTLEGPNREQNRYDTIAFAEFALPYQEIPDGQIQAVVDYTA